MPIGDGQVVKGGVKRAASPTIGIATLPSTATIAARRRGDTTEFSAVTACREQGADVGPAAKPAFAKQTPKREAFARFSEPHYPHIHRDP
jgi:hypothetical protein